MTTIRLHAREEYGSPAALTEAAIAAADHVQEDLTFREEVLTVEVQTQEFASGRAGYLAVVTVRRTFGLICTRTEIYQRVLAVVVAPDAVEVTDAAVCPAPRSIDPETGAVR